MKHRLLTALIAIAALALAATPAALADNPNKDKDTYVQLLAINDFHGHVGVDDRARSGNDPSHDDRGANGRRRRAARVPRDLRQDAADGQHEHDVRRVRRPRRREPADVGALPRRADRRGDEPDGPRRVGHRQPRVRRGPGRDLPPDERRLPSRRRLPGRHAVLRLDLRLPRGERRLRRHERDGSARVRDPQGGQREDRVHRADLREHAARGRPVVDRGPRLPATRSRR